MNRVGLSMMAALMAGAIASQATACRISRPANIALAARGELVVVGRIANYRIIRRNVAEHARFSIRIDEVLRGRAGRVVAAVWTNSTFAMPRVMPNGRYLIALSRSSFEPRGLSVIQQPCARALMFDAGSEEARAVRAMLARAAGLDSN